MSSAIALADTERRLAERIDIDSMKSLTVSSAAGGIVFADADQLTQFAKTMAIANSGIRKHLRGNVGACLAICQQAVEWGMSPYAVANESYFVNDQIAFESQLVQAVILKRAPIKGRIKFEFTGAGDKRVCRAWARLADDPDEIAEYVSPEFGKIIPKNSPLWKADPDQQYCYYSGRALCRWHFPDVLLGVYSEDEFDVAPVPVPARPAAPRTLGAKLDRLASGPTIDHDPETDEVETDQRQDSSAETDDEPETPHDRIMGALRLAAMDSPRKLKFALGKLTADEAALVTPEDRAALNAAAEARVSEDQDA